MFDGKLKLPNCRWHHNNDVIMTTIGSQITSLTVVYSTVYSDADQRKHQSSASLAFVWWIHRDRWIPRTKGQLRGKCFHLMTSSWLSGMNGSEICINVFDACLRQCDKTGLPKTVIMQCTEPPPTTSKFEPATLKHTKTLYFACRA